jgi:hypothetical protein
MGCRAMTAAFERSQFIPLAILILLGLIFYAAGTPTRRKAAEVPISELPPAPATI